MNSHGKIQNITRFNYLLDPWAQLDATKTMAATRSAQRQQKAPKAPKNISPNQKFTHSPKCLIIIFVWELFLSKICKSSRSSLKHVLLSPRVWRRCLPFASRSPVRTRTYCSELLIREVCVIAASQPFVFHRLPFLCYPSSEKS